MECLTTLILSCLLNGSYVSAGLESQFHAHQTDRQWCNGRWCSGPKAVFRIGATLDLNRFELDLGIKHESFANTTRDYGTESAYLSLTWKPFRK